MYDIDYLDNLGKTIKTDSFDEAGKLAKERYFINGDRVIVDV